jgi:single-strand DNA-binding protein
MSDFNQFDVMGRMATDPAEKTTKNDKSYTTFRVAYSRGYGDFKKSNFVSVNVYGRDAEYVLKFGTKGRRVLLSGELAVEQGTSNQNGTPTTWVTMHVTPGGFRFLDAPDETATVSNPRKATQPAPQVDDELIPIGEEIPF